MTQLQQIRQEIERLEKYYAECGYPGMGEYEQGNKQGRLDTLDYFRSFLDTLEQQEKDADLEKEIEAYFKDWSINSYGAFFNEDGYKVSMLGIKNIARHFDELGRQKQLATDADLGSPKYERGFCDGRDFEKDKYKNLIPTLRLCKEWFDEIVEKASRLTTGNVAHLGATIRGFARNYSEYVEEELGKNAK